MTGAPLVLPPKPGTRPTTRVIPVESVPARPDKPSFLTQPPLTLGPKPGQSSGQSRRVALTAAETPPPLPASTLEKEQVSDLTADELAAIARLEAQYGTAVIDESLQENLNITTGSESLMNTSQYMVGEVMSFEEALYNYPWNPPYDSNLYYDVSQLSSSALPAARAEQAMNICRQVWCPYRCYKRKDSQKYKLDEKVWDQVQLVDSNVIFKASSKFLNDLRVNYMYFHKHYIGPNRTKGFTSLKQNLVDLDFIMDFMLDAAYSPFMLKYVCVPLPKVEETSGIKVEIKRLWQSISSIARQQNSNKSWFDNKIESIKEQIKEDPENVYDVVRFMYNNNLSANPKWWPAEVMAQDRITNMKDAELIYGPAQWRFMNTSSIDFRKYVPPPVPNIPFDIYGDLPEVISTATRLPKAKPRQPKTGRAPMPLPRIVMQKPPVPIPISYPPAESLVIRELESQSAAQPTPWREGGISLGTPLTREVDDPSRAVVTTEGREPVTVPRFEIQEAEDLPATGLDIYADNPFFPTVPHELPPTGPEPPPRSGGVPVDVNLYSTSVEEEGGETEEAKDLALLVKPIIRRLVRRERVGEGGVRISEAFRRKYPMTYSRLYADVLNEEGLMTEGPSVITETGAEEGGGVEEGSGEREPMGTPGLYYGQRGEIDPNPPPPVNEDSDSSDDEDGGDGGGGGEGAPIQSANELVPSGTYVLRSDAEYIVETMPSSGYDIFPPVVEGEGEGESTAQLLDPFGAIEAPPPGFADASGPEIQEAENVLSENIPPPERFPALPSEGESAPLPPPPGEEIRYDAYDIGLVAQGLRAMGVKINDNFTMEDMKQLPIDLIQRAQDHARRIQRIQAILTLQEEEDGDPLSEEVWRYGAPPGTQVIEEGIDESEKEAVFRLLTALMSLPSFGRGVMVDIDLVGWVGFRDSESGIQLPVIASANVWEATVNYLIALNLTMDEIFTYGKTLFTYIANATDELEETIATLSPVITPSYSPITQQSYTSSSSEGGGAVGGLTSTPYFPQFYFSSPETTQEQYSSPGSSLYSLMRLPSSSPEAAQPSTYGQQLSISTVSSSEPEELTPEVLSEIEDLRHLYQRQANQPFFRTYSMEDLAKMRNAPARRHFEIERNQPFLEVTPQVRRKSTLERQKHQGEWEVEENLQDPVTVLRKQTQEDELERYRETSLNRPSAIVPGATDALDTRVPIQFRIIYKTYQALCSIYTYLSNRRPQTQEKVTYYREKADEMRQLAVAQYQAITEGATDFSGYTEQKKALDREFKKAYIALWQKTDTEEEEEQETGLEKAEEEAELQNETIYSDEQLKMIAMQSIALQEANMTDDMDVQYRAIVNIYNLLENPAMLVDFEAPAPPRGAEPIVSGRIPEKAAQ